VSTKKTEPDDTITPETFDLMAWIESGTVATRQTTIHNNPALVAESEALEAEMVAAEEAVKAAGGDSPMGATDPRDAIRARMDGVFKRWEASKTVWTVRALSHDDIEDAFDAGRGGVEHPKQPTPPAPTAPEKARERYAERLAAWGKAVAEADRERTLHMIALAVTAIENNRGSIERETGDDPIVTVEALRALRDRPHGEQWVGVIPSGTGGRGQRVTGKLARAIMEATEGDQEVPRPTLPGNSTSNPG
jgi:hypothetical protein